MFFLRILKGQRSVQVENYFPGLQLFGASVKHFMKTESYGETSFTDREMYRLRKLMVKLRSQLESAN